MAKLLLHATHGKDDPERATLPFVVANVAASADQETVVLLTIDGVWLATKGYADGVQQDADLLHDGITHSSTWASSDTVSATSMFELSKINKS